MKLKVNPLVLTVIYWVTVLSGLLAVILLTNASLWFSLAVALFLLGMVFLIIEANTQRTEDSSD